MSARSAQTEDVRPILTKPASSSMKMDSSDVCFVFKNHGKKHKSKPSQFVSVAGGVQKRLESNIKYRKSCRLTEFDSVRDLSREASPAPPVNAKVDDIIVRQEDRRQKLEKWKVEKEKKKKEALAQKKKPFVASVVHAPLQYVPPPPPPGKVRPSSSGRVTRSQTATANKKAETKKNLSFAPKNATFRPPQLNIDCPIPQLKVTNKKSNKKITIVFDPEPSKPANTVKGEKTRPNSRQTKETATRTNTRSKTEPKNTKTSFKKEKKKTPKKSLPKPSSNVTPKVLVPKSESSSEEKLRSPKETVQTPEQVSDEPLTISPCVTLSRGKDNARREMKKKLQEGLLDEDTSDADNVRHFRRQLDAEIARMTRRCETWDEVYENCSLPEFVQELVLGAVGQARLLMSSKLQQFSSLVEKCLARDAGAGLITPADLQGFWDMVFIQIEKVELRFKQLDELRARDWAEHPEPVTRDVTTVTRDVTRDVTQRRQRRNVAASKERCAPSSRIRDMIAAARKAKKEQCVPSLPEASKTFEAGFFRVSSPVRSASSPASPRAPASSQATPRNKHNLLKEVLSSEARKASAAKNSASFAMLRASLIGKNIDMEGVCPLEQTPNRHNLSTINLNATPARSILKPAKPTSAKRQSRRSIKTVLFNKSDTEVTPKTPLYPEIDSGLSSMDVENEKENRRKSVLTRQDATEFSPIMTRNRRKSLQTPKEVLGEVEGNAEGVRRTRRNKSTADEFEIVSKPTPKRASRRNKVPTGDLIDLATPEPASRKRNNRSINAV